MARIGLTTTVPVEIVFAAGHTPVDINNIFVTRTDSMRLVEKRRRQAIPAMYAAGLKGFIPPLLKIGILMKLLR